MNKSFNRTQKQGGNIGYLYFLLVVGVFLTAILSVGVGVETIGAREIFSIIGHYLFDAPLQEGISHGQVTIITQLRMPRILMAMIVGANLAVTGAIFQAIFRNAMADPFMLGISSGASLGAAVGFVMGGFSPFYAFIGAIISNVLVFALSGIKGKVSTMRLLLSGMAINYLFSAILSFIRTYAEDESLMIFAWGLGSLVGASYSRVILLSVISLPILSIFYLYRRELNILMLGDDIARSLGQDVQKIRRLFLILSSLLIAVTVSFTGTIGFVGLIIPHMVRLLVGSNYQQTLLLQVFFGALFVMLCDNVARAILSQAEVPLGIVTSLFGAPYFMYLIYKERRRTSG